MRTWVLLMFCVVVIAAVASAERQGKAREKEDKEKGKNEVKGKDERKGGKRNQLKVDGKGNKRQPTGKNKLEKGNNSGKDFKKNESKGGKRKDRPIKKKSGRGPKKNRPDDEEKVPRTQPRRKNGRKKSLKKKERKSRKLVKNIKPKGDCPGECVAPSDCKGRLRRGTMCEGDQVCCVPKRKRAGRKGTTVKRFCKPLTLCNEKNGECRKKKTGCNLDEKRYKNKKNKSYCDKKSCVCCVRQCSERKKCLKAGGTCMLKKSAKKLCADGDFIMDKKYCDGKKCGCCVPSGGVDTCKQKKTCTKAGGSCVPLGSSCSGGIQTTNSKGKSYCKGSCGCCLTDPGNCTITRGYCPNCGIAPIDVEGVKIVGGVEAAENEYPYQVAVFLGTFRVCGGSIIKRRWILTAAHCFFETIDGNPFPQTGIRIGYGSSNQQALTLVDAVRYIVHENYDNNNKTAYDIALVELLNDLIYEGDATIQPICLAEESDIIIGGKAVVTGWGALFYGDLEQIDQLREVALDIISESECTSLTQITDVTKLVCALTPLKDICQGDSGGPLVVKTCSGVWVQIGVVSFGYRCDPSNGPSVYMRVSAFRAWIDKNTGSSAAC